jgi:hypothetical protein
VDSDTRSLNLIWNRVNTRVSLTRQLILHGLEQCRVRCRPIRAISSCAWIRRVSSHRVCGQKPAPRARSARCASKEPGQSERVGLRPSMHEGERIRARRLAKGMHTPQQRTRSPREGTPPPRMHPPIPKAGHATWQRLGAARHTVSSGTGVRRFHESESRELLAQATDHVRTLGRDFDVTVFFERA